MDSKPQRISRSLYAWEIAEARTIFGSSLAYERVRVHEGVGWPDMISLICRKLRGQPPLDPKKHNAITILYCCFFPVNLPRALTPIDHADEYSICWLIHELMHCWQYQHFGAIRTILKALSVQLRKLCLKENVYNFGGPGNLRSERAKGGTILYFNLEAQAGIAAAYYYRKRHNFDISDFEPFINDIRLAR